MQGILTIPHKIFPIMYKYTVGVEKLIRIDSEQDLGVITSTVLHVMGASREFRHLKSE